MVTKAEARITIRGEYDLWKAGAPDDLQEGWYDRALSFWTYLQEHRPEVLGTWRARNEWEDIKHWVKEVEDGR